jgi:hypothetical protein
VHDDDTWHPEFLERTVGFLERDELPHYIGVLTGCTVLFERIDGATVVEEGREPLAEAALAADLRQLLVCNRCPPISLLFRRAAVERLQGYNAALPVLGDWEFNLRAALLGEIGVIAEPLAFWHQRKSADGVYGNSLFATQYMHARYDRLLRNSLLRIALQERPELLGLMHALLHAVDAQEQRQLARNPGGPQRSQRDRRRGARGAPAHPGYPEPHPRDSGDPAAAARPCAGAVPVRPPGLARADQAGGSGGAGRRAASRAG